MSDADKIKKLQGDIIGLEKVITDIWDCLFYGDLENEEWLDDQPHWDVAKKIAEKSREEDG